MLSRLFHSSKKALATNSAFSHIITEPTRPPLQQIPIVMHKSIDESPCCDKISEAKRLQTSFRPH